MLSIFNQSNPLTSSSPCSLANAVADSSVLVSCASLYASRSRFCHFSCQRKKAAADFVYARERRRTAFFAELHIFSAQLAWTQRRSCQCNVLLCRRGAHVTRQGALRHAVSTWRICISSNCISSNFISTRRTASRSRRAGGASLRWSIQHQRVDTRRASANLLRNGATWKQHTSNMSRWYAIFNSTEQREENIAVPLCGASQLRRCATLHRIDLMTSCGVVFLPFAHLHTVFACRLFRRFALGTFKVLKNTTCKVEAWVCNHPVEWAFAYHRAYAAILTQKLFHDYISTMYMATFRSARNFSECNKWWIASSCPAMKKLQFWHLPI